MTDGLFRGPDESIKRAEAIGKANADIIELAQAWCTHLQVERHGYGLVEQYTGLPVSGGTLRCDYARATVGTAARLDWVALDFYQRNCVGCPHRLSLGVLPNLGTWAERLLDDERRRTASAEEAGRIAEAERVERRKQRRLIAGQLDAEAEAILQLIERLDSGKADPSAREELLALASLRPEAFTSELIQLLLIEAQTNRIAACLEAVIIVHGKRQEPPPEQMVQVAIQGLRRGQAWSACAGILARYLTADAAAVIPQDVFAIAFQLAGPSDDFFPGDHPVDPEPELLLRLFDLARDTTIVALAHQLGDSDLWTRSTAARACQSLIHVLGLEARPLLTALLDGLRMHDPSRYHHEPQSTLQICIAIADLFVVDPDSTDRALRERWTHEGATYRQHIAQCYALSDRGSRSRLLSAKAAQFAGRWALEQCTNSDDDEVLGKAADLWKSLCRDQPESLGVTLEASLGAVALLAERLDSVGRQMKLPATSVLTGLELSTRQSVLRRCLREVREGATALASREPKQFWPLARRMWAEAPDESQLRLALIEMAGDFGRDYVQLPLALPMLYSGMLGAWSSSRAIAIRSIGKIAKEAPVELPAEVTEGVMVALSDRYLAVVQCAAEAVGWLKIPEDRLITVLNTLLNFARNYADSRDDTAKESLVSARRLSRGTAYEPQVSDLILKVIDEMPAFNALETLGYFVGLQARPDWVATAVRALRKDEDPAYGGLGEHDRERVLQALANVDPDRLAPHQDTLIAVGKELIDETAKWAWQIAEVCSSLGLFEAAARTAEMVVSSIPDTLEERPRRLYAQQVAACHRVESAVARDDSGAIAEALKAWKEAEEAAIQDAEQNADARRAGIPTFLPI